MRASRGAAVALALLVMIPTAPAMAGYTTGIGAARTAHVFDRGNGVEAWTLVPEDFYGATGHTFVFVLHGSYGTFPFPYNISVVVGPGSDVEARFNASGRGPTGQFGNSTINVTIPPDALPYSSPNTPFQVELRDDAGVLLDTAQVSVDVHNREPPPDGGLFQLAIASGFFWGLVFLYALNLHLTQRKLRARADALERSLQGADGGVAADGTKR